MFAVLMFFDRVLSHSLPGVKGKALPQTPDPVYPGQPPCIFQSVIIVFGFRLATATLPVTSRSPP